MTTEEILRDLRRLQQHTFALKVLFAQAQAWSPQRSEGTDDAGAVRVVLGSEGLPESIRVASDWQHRLTAKDFGEAVTAAGAAAIGERMASFSKALNDDGLRAKVDRLEADRAGRPGIAESDAAPGITAEDVRGSEPRSLDAVVEDVIKALDRATEFTTSPQQAVAGTGSAAAGRLVLTVSQTGWISCKADLGWVSRQAVSGLSSALGQALASARSDLARASEATAAANPIGPLHRLFHEALAILSDPKRQAGP